MHSPERKTMTTSTDNELAAAQQDEYESIAAIFPDEFTLHSQDPINYSILLVPPSASDGEVYTARSHLWPCERLRLKVNYPPTYPDDTVPNFGITNCKGEESVLHDFQLLALLNHLSSTAEAEIGMPSVLSCYYAAIDFFETGGLVQAGLALLSDDCLSNILAYLATSKEAIDAVSEALPIFASVAKTDTVWKELCRIRWREKWGFEKRWQRAVNDFMDQYEPQSRTTSQYFWHDRYQFEERDGTRTSTSVEELCSMTFQCYQWFDTTGLLRQSDHMRDVMPTGLGKDCGSIVRFFHNGLFSYVIKERECPSGAYTFSVDGEAISMNGLRLRTHRLPSWGWEMTSDLMVMRSINDEGGNNLGGLWDDLISCMTLQQRPDWITTTLGLYPYNYREIPEDADLMSLLPW